MCVCVCGGFYRLFLYFEWVLGSFLFSITEEAILGVVWNRWKWGQKDEGNAEEKWGSQLTHSCHGPNRWTGGFNSIHFSFFFLFPFSRWPPALFARWVMETNNKRGREKEREKKKEKREKEQYIYIYIYIHAAVGRGILLFIRVPFWRAVYWYPLFLAATTLPTNTNTTMIITKQREQHRHFWSFSWLSPPPSYWFHVSLFPLYLFLFCFSSL